MFQNVTDDDLIALVADEVFQPQVIWKLGDAQVSKSFVFRYYVICYLSSPSNVEYMNSCGERLHVEVLAFLLQQSN